MTARAKLILAKGVVWLAALVPLGHLLWGAMGGDLGADPVETLLHETGTWGLTLLLVTLTVTPIRRITNWNRVIRLRRLLGLFAYFYAVLHVGVYLVLDQGLAPRFILQDVAERPYVTAGAGAFLILTLLAVTSTRKWIRRLGRGWQRLHRLVYLAGGLVIVHFVWQVKADAREPLIYAGVFAVLMLFRVPWRELGSRVFQERFSSIRRRFLKRPSDRPVDDRQSVSACDTASYELVIPHDSSRTALAPGRGGTGRAAPATREDSGGRRQHDPRKLHAADARALPAYPPATREQDDDETERDSDTGSGGSFRGCRLRQR